MRRIRVCFITCESWADSPDKCTLTRQVCVTDILISNARLKLAGRHTCSLYRDYAVALSHINISHFLTVKDDYSKETTKCQTSRDSDKEKTKNKQNKIYTLTGDKRLDSR